MSAIAQLFYKKVKNGEMTIDQVPATWRAEVEAMLAADNQQEVS